MKADVRAPKFHSKNQAYTTTQLYTHYFCWKGRGTKIWESGLIVYYTQNRNHEKEKEHFIWKLLLGLKTKIKEPLTFAQLTLEGCVSVTPFSLHFPPFLNMTMDRCYPVPVTLLYYMLEVCWYVGGRNLSLQCHRSKNRNCTPKAILKRLYPGASSVPWFHLYDKNLDIELNS